MRAIRKVLENGESRLRILWLRPVEVIIQNDQIRLPDMVELSGLLGSYSVFNIASQIVGTTLTQELRNTLDIIFPKNRIGSVFVLRLHCDGNQILIARKHIIDH